MSLDADNLESASGCEKQAGSGHGLPGERDKEFNPITRTTRNLHMELVFGHSVAEATVVAHGDLGERGTHGVLLSVAAALRYLHEEAGVVHGDVKGRNVLLGGRCDAHDQGCGEAGLRRRPAGRAGRPRGWLWRSARRCGDAGVRHLGLGCTALELLTGNRPWSELGGASEVGELLLLVGFGRGAKARTG